MRRGDVRIVDFSVPMGSEAAYLAVERIDEHVGRVPPDLMSKVDDALRLHLAL